MKKALAILGSPRKQGNAAGLLNIAAEQAGQAGYDVEKLDLYEQSIGWCKGCMACKRTGICVIEDDIVPIRESLPACVLMILSAPTFFANVPAPVKNMFDRLVEAVMDDNHSVMSPLNVRPSVMMLNIHWLFMLTNFYTSNASLG